MSRKALFAKLGPTGSSKGEQSNASVPEQPSPVEEAGSRGGRMRMRPILNAPELIPDSSATPVGAIGQSLGEFAAKAKRAEEIERRLSQGQAVVELAPELIDPSFVADRMPSTPEAHAKLLRSIEEHGQQVPILVRPHPKEDGRYQVAYGHRRLRVLAELGRPVRAVVRNLADEDLVIAQGQENSERQDLSFIEKARFARRLEQRFRRDTILAAMSIYKSDLSNMLSVVARIPDDIVDAIGAAPGIGRRGWIDLADQLADPKVAAPVRKIAMSKELQSLGSDERFRHVLGSIKPRTHPTRAETWSASNGAKLARVVQSEDRVSLTIDRRAAPAFADFVLGRLKDLYLEFEAGRSDQP